jgi:glycine/D-amino acid oxidase-like deaminating enzyme
MSNKIIIVGQGLCGTWLSYWLHKAGAQVVVIDEAKANTASRVASGIINPVTGRRMVKTWMADELMEFAHHAYDELGLFLSKSLITKTSILDFFSAPDRRLSFEKRALQFEEFLNWPEDEHDQLHFFNYPFGYGIVSPAYLVDVQTMLEKWRLHMEANAWLMEERFDTACLVVEEDGIIYKNIQADKIIFCDGIQTMQLPFFSLLPFAINKGEALIVQIPGLPSSNVYKKTNTITPWKKDLIWVGSSYDRDYTDDKPSAIFFEQTNQWLQQFLKIPFSIVDHIAALRPTTVERRPFVGLHPLHPSVGILNGMGTKGVSLAPYFAKQLCEHLLYQQPILPLVDVKQYRRVLQRT